jgi:hypothetical protein
MNTDGPQKHMLSGWTSIATRTLCHGGPEAWCVVDDAMGHAEVDGIVRNLRDDLSLHSLTGRTTASRTVKDAKVSQLLDIPLPSSSSATPPTPSVDTPSSDPTSLNSASLVRGDRSMFLGRDVIQAADVEAKNPRLSHLLRSVVNTVSCHVTSVDFDLSLTSVQLAEYPGDGVSGYL